VGVCEIHDIDWLTVELYKRSCTHSGERRCVCVCVCVCVLHVCAGGHTHVFLSLLILTKLRLASRSLKVDWGGPALVVVTADVSVPVEGERECA
jgi:hypothetical protein